MIKKFECWECHHRFEAEEHGVVECPNCHSDNIGPARFHLPKPKIAKVSRKILLGVLGVLAMALLAFFGWKHWPISSSETEEEVAVSDSESVIIEIPATIVEPPSLEVGELSFDDEGYSFETKIKNPPQGSYEVVLLDLWDDTKIIATSKDGKFAKVPCMTDEDNKAGDYRIAIRATANDSLLCEPKVVPGFIPQVKVSAKMTAEQLQARIASRDESLMGIGENACLAPDVKLKFTGLPKDARNIPEVLSEVFEKLDMGTWDAATVSALEYDDLNRISVITFKVVVGDGF